MATINVKYLRTINHPTLKAFCRVNINEVIEIGSVKVVQGKDGLFVSMPSEQDKNGKWWPVVSIKKDELKQQISDTVLEAYNNGQQSQNSGE